MTRNLQSHLRRKLMKFWITHFRSRFAPVRYDPLSCYVYHMYIALCLPPKFCIDFCFQILLGGLYIPQRIWTQYLMQNLRATRVHYGGFENSQWEGGACTPAAPFPHYSPLRSHGIFLASHIREFWSRKFSLRTCLHQKDRNLIKRVHLLRVFLSLSSAKSAPSIWQSAPSASRSLSKCRLHGFKVETSNSVHCLTNFRSMLLVTSRISCYEAACARLSESGDAAKTKRAKRK